MKTPLPTPLSASFAAASASPAVVSVPRPETCRECGGTQIVFDRTRERARARACRCAAACPKCEGTGKVFVEEGDYSFARECDCRDASRRAARYTGVGIPSLFAGQSFESYRPYSAEQEKARKLCRDIATLYRRDSPPKGVVISGPVGSGKTHLLCATLGYLALEQAVNGQYVEISFLFSEIRNGFQAGRSGLDAILPLVETEVLAIDEMGKGKGSPFELDTLDELIARRYNGGRTTLIATNYSTAESARRSPPSGGFRQVDRDSLDDARPEQLLRDRVGERIYSRLHQMCHFVEFTPDALDYRRGAKL
jgi:DNA replication protein DnaC